MARKAILMMPSLILGFLCVVGPANGTDLELGKAQEALLNAGKAQPYTLVLTAGDFVELNIEPGDLQLIVTAYSPSGEKVRASKLAPQPHQKFQFLADNSGEFLLDISDADTTKQGAFTLIVTRIVTLQERLAPAIAKKNESPRLKALSAALDAGQQDAVSQFWEEVRAKGEPLIETVQGQTVQGQESDTLVTFLWRGTPETKNVLVAWMPFALQWPEDYKMNRLGETDVWFRTLRVDKRKRFAYLLIPNAPFMRASLEPNSDQVLSIAATGAQIDPLNPQRLVDSDPDDPDLAQYRGLSVVEMPDAPPQPWLVRRPEVPTGKIVKEQFKSLLLHNEREVAIYTPANYSKDAEPYALLILFDGGLQLGLMQTPTTLDNLIAEKRIPPLVTIFVSNAAGDARARELPCNPTFADFLNSELLPWVRRNYKVTHDPAHTVVGGLSYGGLAAAYVAFRHPESFGNVLSQSGSYWWTPPRSDNPNDFDLSTEPNWLAKQFIASRRLPLRIYMDAGIDELDFTGRGAGILETNREMRDVLLAKGYEVHYQEFDGGHDFLSWRGTLADGLIALMANHAESNKPRAITTN